MSAGPGSPHPADAPGPLVFVEDLAAPELAPADRHHLERVLRLRRGDPLVVSDGAGRWRRCRLGARLEPLGEVEVRPSPGPPLAVGFALLKGERPELVVQKLTELGIDRILPFTAARSVVRWDAARAGRHLTRLRAVARAAAAQCRRPQLPEIAPVAPFAQVAGLTGAARCDRGGGPPSLARPVLLVGPEGGWHPAETALDLPVVGLGAHVLRAETAAVTAGALLAALRAELVREIRPEGHVR